MGKRWPDSYPDIQGNSPEIKALMRALFPDKVKAVEAGLCPACNRPVEGQDGFRDELSWREYLITGMCQACQDMMETKGDVDDC